MKKIDSILGVDFITSSNGGTMPINPSIRRAGTSEVINYAMEAEATDHSGFSADKFNGAQFDTRYFFKDLTPQDIDDLINKRAYLEFWLPVVNHDEQTGLSGNNKYYSENDIDGAMTPSFINRMNTGGVEGRCCPVI